MNLLFSRTWQIVAVLVILALMAAWSYLRFIGWHHPFAKYIGAYNHRIATLGEYIRYKHDPKRFRAAQNAATLSFDCERIRDDLVKLTQSIISPELSTSPETIVWRKAASLTFAIAASPGVRRLRRRWGSFLATRNSPLATELMSIQARRATTELYSKLCSHLSRYTEEMRARILASISKEARQV